MNQNSQCPHCWGDDITETHHPGQNGVVYLGQKCNTCGYVWEQWETRFSTTTNFEREWERRSWIL